MEDYTTLAEAVMNDGLSRIPDKSETAEDFANQPPEGDCLGVRVGESLTPKQSSKRRWTKTISGEWTMFRPNFDRENAEVSDQ